MKGWAHESFKGWEGRLEERYRQLKEADHEAEATRSIAVLLPGVEKKRQSFE